MQDSTSSLVRRLVPQPLTATAFAPFGVVVELPEPQAGIAQRAINSGTTQRHDLLPDMQLTAEGGVPMLAIFRAQPRSFPMPITEMERHALGSQTFIPLGGHRFVVVVAPVGKAPQAGDLRAFITNGHQGITLAPGVWHHPLMAVEGGDFDVIERAAAQVDCDIVAVSPAAEVGGIGR